MASKPASWLCRRADVFLGRLLLAYNGDDPGLVRPAVLHGDLCCGLGLVLRSYAPEIEANPGRHEQMGPDAFASANACDAGTVTMDKIHKQSATRVSARSRVDHGRMVARMGFLRVRLERPGRRAAR